MANGTVKFFNTQNGFGFIETETGGKDVFVHISAVERSGLTGLADAQKVTFDVETGRDGRESACNLALWAVQISFNTLWSGVFFGLKTLRGGFLVLAGLWLAVLVTTLAYLQADLLAGLLFAPYLLWVSVALALNLSVWRRNGQVA